MLQQPHPYGSAFRRLLAFAFDSLLLGVVGAGIDLSFGVSPGLTPEALAQQPVFPSLLKLAFHLVYWPMFESSVWQATPGKRLCRLCVADLAGNRLSFVRAFIRNISKLLSLLTFGFGFLMIFVTIRNQCLHDKIAGSVVLKKTRPASTPTSV